MRGEVLLEGLVVEPPVPVGDGDDDKHRDGDADGDASADSERLPLAHCDGAVVGDDERHSDGDADEHAVALPERVPEAAEDALARAEGINDAADDRLRVGLAETQRDAERVALVRGVGEGQGETLLERPREPVEEGDRVCDTAGLAVRDGKRDHEGGALGVGMQGALMLNQIGAVAGMVTLPTRFRASSIAVITAPLMRFAKRAPFMSSTLLYSTMAETLTALRRFTSHQLIGPAFVVTPKVHRFPSLA